MITYQIETIEDTLEELKPILHKHHKEASSLNESIELDPDYDAYEMMDENGYILFYTARDDGKLIGYCLYFILKDLQHKSHLVAKNDFIFIDPSYRKTGVSVELFKRAEEVLRDLGVSYITQSMKKHREFKTLMDILEYDELEVVYHRWIGDRKDG